MQDTDLFLSLAEIAGVFVGFGALIAVRSGGAREVEEVAYMRTVVWMGLMAAVAALAPVTIGRYALSDHQVWALSSIVVLVGCLGFAALNARTPEFRASWTASARFELVLTAVYLLYVIALLVAPVIVILGLLPELEAALYFTVVVLILLGAAWSLLWLVFSQRRAATA